jgi:hypothetical protein
MKVFEFENLSQADLVVGATYKGGRKGHLGDDPLSKLLGVGNAGGFRFRTRDGFTKVVVLYSTSNVSNWIPTATLPTGSFQYFGDNDTPGREIHDTPHKGNELLKKSFEAANEWSNSYTPPLFLHFRKTGLGRDVQLLAFAVPKRGLNGLSETVIETTKGKIKNYIATFEVLGTSIFLRSDLNTFMSTRSGLGPEKYENWLKKNESRGITQLNESTLVKDLDIQPGTSVFDIFPNITYTPWFALGEMIDNSISSFQEDRESKGSSIGKTLTINIKWDKETQTISIEDDAAGIPLGEHGWDRVLKLAQKKANPRFLSVFGYGLKAAALWWSPRLIVESKVAGEPNMHFAEIDRNSLDGASTTELRSRPEDAELHYTRITLVGLNKNREIPHGPTTTRIKSYLQSMYRVYLRADEKQYQTESGAPWLSLVVQGEKLKPTELDLLKQPFWSSTLGPEKDSKEITWKTPMLKFEIPRSQGPGEPRVITGWVGILKTGKPNDAGFLMLYRGKGIVGVGQGTNSNNDLYRPTPIVGTGNTNRRQRYVGEFDISAFGKSVTTDAIDWSSGEEEEFLRQLKRSLQNPEFNIWEMAENWRPTRANELRSIDLTTYENAAASASSAANNEDIRSGSNQLWDAQTPEAGGLDTTQASPDLPSNNEAFAFERSFTNEGVSFRFEGALAGVSSNWLSVFEVDAENVIIRINQNHPYMRDFAYVPGHNPEPIYRLAIAICLAERKSSSPGLRLEVNRLLNGPIGRKSWSEDD